MSRKKDMKRTMEIHKYMLDFQNKNEFSPTVRDVVNAFKYNSTSVAHLYIRRLLDMGYAIQKGHQIRAVEK